MKYIELNESAYAPLYHGTTFAAALSIVQDGGFDAVGYIFVKGSPILHYGLSLTRSPRLSHIDHNPTVPMWKKLTNIYGFNVVFILDQNALRQHYKLIPFDYFSNSKTTSVFDHDKLKLARTESEEFIVIGKGNRLPLKKFVKKIIYFSGSFPEPESQPDSEEFVRFKQFALQYTIPVVISDSQYSFNDMNRSWNTKLQKSMVKYPTKNEVKLSNRTYDVFNVGKLKKMVVKYDEAGASSFTTEEVNQLFNRSEIFTLWQLLFAINARPPKEISDPLPAKTAKILFNILRKLDPKDPVIYRNIPEFIPAIPASTQLAQKVLPK